MEKFEKGKNLTVEWTDVHPGPNISMAIFANREEIKKYVGEPLLSACEELYDKNIRTVSSIWKKSDVEYDGLARIIIHYDSLSEANKKVVQQLAKKQGTEVSDTQYRTEKMKVFDLHIPITTKMTKPEIERILKESIKDFQWQPLTWAPQYSLDDLRKSFADPDLSLEEAIEYADEVGWYYDSENNLFYLSKEQYEKTKDIKI